MGWGYWTIGIVLELVHLEIGCFHPFDLASICWFHYIVYTEGGGRGCSLLLLSHKINWCLKQILLKIPYFITHQDWDSFITELISVCLCQSTHKIEKVKWLVTFSFSLPRLSLSGMVITWFPCDSNKQIMQRASSRFCSIQGTESPLLPHSTQRILALQWRQKSSAAVCQRIF